MQTAYNREMRISKEYALFAKNAEKNRYSAIANLYKAASRSEEIHAEMAASLLRSKGIEVAPYVADSIVVGTVMQTLHLALSDESLETESMYPNLARTAEAEKFPEAAESFGHSLTADKWNAELFKDAVDKSGYITRCNITFVHAADTLLHPTRPKNVRNATRRKRSSKKFKTGKEEIIFRPIRGVDDFYSKADTSSSNR